MTEIHSKERIRWACRRGMLELDVLFMPFVEEAFDSLSKEQQAVFQRLLECDDPDLFAWFMGHEECKDPELNGMVSLIFRPSSCIDLPLQIIPQTTNPLWSFFA